MAACAGTRPARAATSLSRFACRSPGNTHRGTPSRRADRFLRWTLQRQHTRTQIGDYGRQPCRKFRRAWRGMHSVAQVRTVGQYKCTYAATRPAPGAALCPLGDGTGVAPISCRTSYRLTGFVSPGRYDETPGIDSYSLTGNSAGRGAVYRPHGVGNGEHDNSGPWILDNQEPGRTNRRYLWSD